MLTESFHRENLDLSCVTDGTDDKLADSKEYQITSCDDDITIESASLSSADDADDKPPESKGYQNCKPFAGS